MDVIFNELALEEFNDAVSYYELEISGLGAAFREEIRKAIKRITEYPKSWSVEKGDVRKHLLHKFPYKISYSIESDHIYIIAIAHLHRKPDYWVDRYKT